MAKISKPESTETVAASDASSDAAAAADSTSASASAAPAVEAAAGAAGANATKSGNVVILASGERRVDYIKRRFAEKATRGQIAKELGVPYQIVFAATKTKKDEGAAAQAGAAAVATASAASGEQAAA